MRGRHQDGDDTCVCGGGLAVSRRIARGTRSGAGVCVVSSTCCHLMVRCIPNFPKYIQKLLQIVPSVLLAWRLNYPFMIVWGPPLCH